MKPKLLLIALLILIGRMLYAQAPAITSFSPASGAVGTLVTITGANLSGPTAFTIGGTTALIISNTGTKLVGYVMPGAVTGTVAITTSGGTTNTKSNFTVNPTTTTPLSAQLNGTLESTVSGSYQQGSRVAVSADGNTAVTNTSGNSVIVWARTATCDAAGMWSLQAQFSGTNNTNFSGQAGAGGVAISADGNTIAVGGPNIDTSATSYDETGAIWVFTRSGSTWSQQGPQFHGSGGISGPLQGYSVAMSADGNTILEGGIADNSSKGAAWIFTRSNGIWTQQGPKLVGTGNIGPAAQGWSCALSADGNTAIIGGIDDNSSNPGESGVGAAWVFVRNGSSWIQQGAKLVGSGYVIVNEIVEEGYAVALSADGNTAIVTGDNDNNGQGAIWAFTRTNGTWAQQGSKLVGTGNVYGALQGTGVGLSADGNTLLEGGWQDNLNVGAMWEFTRSNGNWTQLGSKIASPLTSKSGFGYSVAVSADGTTAFGGAFQYPGNQYSGAIIANLAPPPTANTQAATNITTTGATLNGSMTTNGYATTVTIQYSTSPSLAGATTATLTTGTSPIPASTCTASFTSVLTGLTPNTTYYFNITGTNTFGTTQGAILSFTTTSALPVITFTSPGDVVYGSITTPIISSTDTIQPFNYRSVNPAVVAITADNKFHAVGVGSTSIVAYQYAPGTNTIEASASANITVTPAPLVVTADNKTVPYGQPIPPLTVTYKGFVNGDTTSNLTTQATVFTQAQQYSAAGVYAIHNYANASDPNYSFSYVDGQLTITQILPVPTAETIAATNITSTTTTLNGTASGKGATDTIKFEYTTDNRDGFEDYTTVSTTTGLNPLPPNSSDTTFTANITGLLPGTTYYFRIVSVNGEFTVNGNMLSFTTPAVLNPETITFAQLPAEVYGTADIAPGATSTNTAVPITYSSSNTAVATILNNQIHITGVGATQITASQAGDATHSSATPVTQSFTVTAAPLTITPNHATKVYGQVNPEFTVNYSGFVNGDNSSVLTTQPSVNTGAGRGTGVGIYQLTASGAAAANYTISYLTDTLVITPASLVITPDNANKAYGTNNPAFTATYAGFVNGDTPNSLTIQPSLVTSATDTSSVGTYPITAIGAGDNNYTITYKPGTLTITAIGLTITADNQTMIYGGGLPALTVSYEGFVNSDNANSITKPTVSTTATGTSGVGSYPITVSGASAKNYTITYLNGTLTITPASLTITADNQTKVQGAENPTLTVTYSGFVNDDSQSSLTTPPRVTTTATTNSPAGTYPITASGAVDANYNITYIAGTLTVGAALSISPFPTTTYGNPDFNTVTTGSNISYSSSSTTVATISSTGTIHITGAGSTTITISSGGQSVNQVLVVNPAPLTITANDQSRPYNTANPDLTVSYTGFVYSDSQSSLSAQPTAVTTATTTSDAGTYPITASGAEDANYTISYTAGTLTITQAEQTITFAVIPDLALPATYDLSKITASSGLPVTFSLSDELLASVSGTTLTSLRTGTETLTASQAGNTNYKAAPDVSRTFNITNGDDGGVIVSMVVSPNGDGINDVLRIINIENYPNNRFILYNRDGAKIYEMNHYNNKDRVFDGHSNITGVYQQQGTYLYKLEYYINGVYKTKTGFTELRYSK